MDGGGQTPNRSNFSARKLPEPYITLTETKEIATGNNNPFLKQGLGRRLAPSKTKP